MSQTVKELMIDISLNDAKLNKLQGSINRLKKSLNSLKGDKLNIAKENLAVMESQYDKLSQKAEKFNKELQTIGSKNDLSSVRDNITDIGHSLKMGDVSGLSEQINDARNQLLGLARSANSLELQPQIKKANQELDIMEKRLNAAQAQINKTSTAFGAFWESSRMGALGFNGTLLSILFFGMEMKRIFGGALRSIFDGYKKIIPESHKFNVMTTRLSANWEFFKFQLADVMANSRLFQRFIQFLIQIIQKFQGLSENTKLVLLSLMAIVFAFGSILFMVGVWGMGMAALSDSVTALSLGFGKMKGTMSGISFGKFVRGGLILAAIAAAIYLAKKAFDTYADSSDYARERSEKLGKGWMNILNQVINPTTKAIDGQKISLQNLSEVGVYFGAVLSNAFALIGMAVSFLIMVVRQIYNALTGLIKLIGAGFLTAIEALLNGFAAVADTVGWDKAAASARAYASDIDGITQSLNRMIAQDLNDMGGSVKDFMDTGDLLMGSLASPAEAVRQYRQELNKLDQQQKSQTGAADMILSQNSRLGTSGSQTTNVQQNIIVDGEGNPQSGMQTPEQQIIWERLQELGRDYGNIGGN